MAHQRKTIRDAIVTAVTGLTTTSTSVFTDRIYPVDITEFPALTVMTGDETVDEDAWILETATGGVLESERQLEIEIRAHAAGATYQDTLDQISLEVETAVNADLTLGGEVQRLWYIGATPDRPDEFEKPAGTLTLLYRCNYLTDGRDPQSNL